jgi:dTDP-4-dehydrorhamnose reductase
MAAAMRVIITGRHGQLATALAERAAGRGVTLVACGRPELDLEHPASIAPALSGLTPDIIINAAAWTAVDRAESEPERAHAINAAAAGAVATTAAMLGVPVIQISTDYVFDGSATTRYQESDPVAPLGVYGQSKLAGERAVMAATGDHAILRTSWVFSATGQNFVRTMLRLAETRSEISVVADQIGRPTPADDLADAVLDVAANLLAKRGEPAMRGIFHVGGTGDATSWADFAEAIFAERGRRGGSAVSVRPIGTADYPTPARRPAWSVLDGARLKETHGIILPDWRIGLARCMDRLMTTEQAP